MSAPGRASAGYDLTNCDREPIHVPGAIQPHGAMLVLDGESLRIVQAAGAVERLLGCTVERVLGSDAGRIMGPQQLERLRALAAQPSLVAPRHLLDPAMRVRPDQPVDASVHRVGDVLLLEFEEADPASAHAADPLTSVQEMAANLAGAASTQSFCELGAEQVRSVTGYDRVMVYRFAEDGSGWVFAEAKAEDLPPYLDLHYPASDIPRQARELYLRNPLRVIRQVDYEPAPLVPPLGPGTGAPLDMSQALLRDVSPLHREYLRNMGVRAAMSISIVVRGQLWGLIACHHAAPRFLPRPVRAICEIFGAMFSLQLEAREQAEQLQARVQSRDLLSQILRELTADEDYADGLLRQSGRLLRYIDAGGLALRSQATGGISIKVDGAIRSAGQTPEPAALAAFTDWLSSQPNGDNGVFVTDRLPELWPPARGFASVGAGVLAVSISREPRDYVLWFRPEQVRTVRWAGNPAKPVEAGPHGDRLTPRRSFDAWAEEVRGRAAPWVAADSDAAFDLRVALMEIVLRNLDVVARERERAQAQERLLMAELDHRVKNTLASIQALVRYSGRSTRSVEQLTETLSTRILAISKAHSLLTDSRWTNVRLRKLLAVELEAFDGGDRLLMSGGEVELTPKAALSLALAVHELVTNAAKYGALSVSGGRVLIDWARDGEGDLRLLWQESGGPPVRPPARRGFGTTLIERALTAETGGRSTLHYDRTGVRCEIGLPQAAWRPAAVAPRPRPPSAPEIEAGDGEVVASRPSVLVVEDSALVAMEIEEVVEALGWPVIGPAAQVSEALRLADQHAVDLAVLDVNLAGELSWPVAEKLRARGVPILFLTGYDGAAVLPEQLVSRPVMGKPFDRQQLTRRLQGMVRPKSPVDPS